MCEARRGAKASSRVITAIAALMITVVVMAIV